MRRQQQRRRGEQEAGNARGATSTAHLLAFRHDPVGVRARRWVARGAEQKEGPDRGEARSIAEMRVERRSAHLRRLRQHFFVLAQLNAQLV